jgi:RNA-directed DNA polymerase
MKLEAKQVIQIEKKISEMQSKEDLLLLLNTVKEWLDGEKYRPFKMRQLTYFADSAKSLNRYKTFTIQKKSGGERQINAPIGGLKSILKVLNVIIQNSFETHKSANGFILNRSIVDNAKSHVSKKYVYNIDLKDFFHSFDKKRVKGALMQEPFNLSGTKEKLAFLIASLCTHPLEINRKNLSVLPQGSPTSPTLTNLLCIRLDRRLNGLAKKVDAIYTRYADDITFSASTNVFKKESFQNELQRIIIEDQQLEINPKKTRLQKHLHRQEVTGLTVNEKVNVPQRYIKQLRMWIYYWEKYGYLRAQQLFSNDYKKDKGHIYKMQPNFVSVVGGKLNFLKMVKGDNDPTYIKLKQRFEKLMSANENIKNVLDLWENVGIESAMERYYLGYVKDKIKINSNPTDSDFGLNEILIEKFFKLDFIEFRDGTCEKK